MMNKEQLEAIKERVVNATPGEWIIDNSSDDRPYITDIWFDGEENGHVEIHRYGAAAESYDAEFIAHARQDVPALIAEVERLQKTNRERAEIIEEQNKELNNFRMNKSLMDFGISTERVRVVEKEKITNQAFRNRKRQVKHLTKGCIRRNAEIERLQQFEQKAIYVIEENKRLQKERNALEFHLKVSSKALELEGENADTFQRALEKIYNDIGILTSQEIYRIVEDALEGMMALGDGDE